MEVLEIPCQSDKIISRIEHGIIEIEFNFNKILKKFRSEKRLPVEDGLLALNLTYVSPLQTI